MSTLAVSQVVCRASLSIHKMPQLLLHWFLRSIVRPWQYNLTSDWTAAYSTIGTHLVNSLQEYCDGCHCSHVASRVVAALPPSCCSFTCDQMVAARTTSSSWRCKRAIDYPQKASECPKMTIFYSKMKPQTADEKIAAKNILECSVNGTNQMFIETKSTFFLILLDILLCWTLTVIGTELANS